MPSEYKVINISILDRDDRDIEAQLNFYGYKDWELKSVVPEFGIVILQREIAINEKLREVQLKEDEDYGSSETAENVPG